MRSSFNKVVLAEMNWTLYYHKKIRKLFQKGDYMQGEKKWKSTWKSV